MKTLNKVVTLSLAPMVVGTLKLYSLFLYDFLIASKVARRRRITMRLNLVKDKRVDGVVRRRSAESVLSMRYFNEM